VAHLVKHHEDADEEQEYRIDMRRPKAASDAIAALLS